jgi:two-component system, OmpR family, sensor kinase
MSVRLRLTMLYSTILALTLIMFSVVVYLTVSRVTFGILEDTLADEAQRIADPNRFRLNYVDYPARKFAAPETYVQTRSLDGTVSDRTAELEEDNVILPLSPSGLRTCQGGQPWSEIVTTEHGRLMIYSKPVVDQDKNAGIVQVARSLAEHDQSLGTLRSILLIGSGVVTVITFGIGWVIAGVSLRPITRLTQTAQAIGAERDFGRRVQHTGPNDEYGRLATTFNTMLTELQAAYRQAEQLLQAQRRLVADASHELRTPLTTIRGNLGLLQREPPIEDEDRVAVLADMVDECERLMRLVNDLLALARADAGRPLRSEPVPVKPLIEEVCRQARHLDLGRPIDCEDVADVTAIGNRDALKQVLLILLDNALKFTPPAGEIGVTATRSGRRIVIRVRDTGAGIDPKILPHVFERFYRGDAARTGAGAGLGLAIAKTLIDAQHGTIGIESQPGRGTVMSLTLPAADIRSDPTDAPKFSAYPQTERGSQVRAEY